MSQPKMIVSFGDKQETSKFLLSICIPTYNRSAFLAQTIESIVTQPSFREGSCVELIVLDNCSQDSTSELCMMYLELYPENFKYHRQLEPVQADINFRDVLNLASGDFLRLNNDTLMHDKHSLRYMLNVLGGITSSSASENRETPFFSNGSIRLRIYPIYCPSMDSFLRLTCGTSTYIGAFGIWRDDFHLIQNCFSELAWKNHLGHVDCLFRLFELGRSIVIDNCVLATMNLPIYRGGYDIGEVVVAEYLRLCQRCVRLGLITSGSMLRETRRSIINASKWFNNQLLYPNLYRFEFKDFFVIVKTSCSERPILLAFFYLHMYFDYFLKFCRKSIKQLLLYIKRR